MKTALFALFVLVAAPQASVDANVFCMIQTEAGNIGIELYPQKAPISVNNFLSYVDKKLYDDTTFFRVVTLANQPENQVKIEVIQGGDIPDEKALPAIVHETTKRTGILHRHGAVSMARSEPGSATSSFFICIHDQPELDFGGKRNPDGQGFAAFGQVVSGMDVVERIHHMENDQQRLIRPINILSIRRLPKKPG